MLAEPLCGENSTNQMLLQKNKILFVETHIKPFAGSGDLEEASLGLKILF